MKQVSNRTLTLLLLTAIVISIGSTMVSLSRLNRIGPIITGMAPTATGGKVNVTVASVASIQLVDSIIDFGACSPNTTGTNLSSNNSDGWGVPSSVCTVAGAAVTNADNITIQNDGNKNVNVSVKSSAIAGASFIAGTDPEFKFMTRNSSRDNRGGCNNVTRADVVGGVGFSNTSGVQWDWQSFAVVDTEYLACMNLSFVDTADQFELYARVFLPSDAPAGLQQNATLTFKAAEW